MTIKTMQEDNQFRVNSFFILLSLVVLSSMAIAGNVTDTEIHVVSYFFAVMCLLAAKEVAMSRKWFSKDKISQAGLVLRACIYYSPLLVAMYASYYDLVTVSGFISNEFLSMSMLLIGPQLIKAWHYLQKKNKDYPVVGGLGFLFSVSGWIGCVYTTYLALNNIAN